VHVSAFVPLLGWEVGCVTASGVLSHYYVEQMAPVILVDESENGGETENM
jgi:hypothetical protein